MFKNSLWVFKKQFSEKNLDSAETTDAGKQLF